MLFFLCFSLLDLWRLQRHSNHCYCWPSWTHPGDWCFLEGEYFVQSIFWRIQFWNKMFFCRILFWKKKNLCKISSCRILFQKNFFVKYHPSSKTLSCPMLFCNIAHCGTLMKIFQQPKQSCKGTTCELKSPLVFPNVDEVVFGPTICKTMEWIEISHKQTQNTSNARMTTCS